MIVRAEPKDSPSHIIQKVKSISAREFLSDKNSAEFMALSYKGSLFNLGENYVGK